MKLFRGIDSAKIFERNRKNGSLVSKVKNFDNYRLYEFNPDSYEKEGSKEYHAIKKTEK